MAKAIADGFGIKLHGKAGNVVFAQTRYGLVVRPRTAPANPRTPAQVAARQRLAVAAGAWRYLDPFNRAAWVLYAQLQTRYSRFGGPPTHPAPNACFIALAAKFLQVNPAGAIPLAPPATPFSGDGITLTAAAGAGAVTFTASGPNSSGVVTELLLQPLPHVGRASKERGYQPHGFMAFAPGSLSHTVAVTPGAYAPAFRFVRAATGQQVEMVRLPAVQVP